MLCALASVAREITPAQAKSIAARYVRLGNARSVQQFGVTPYADENGVSYYAFNDAGGKGFVLISGDDCVNPVLGYSHTGSFDKDNLPPALRGWLEAVSAGIQHMRQQGGGIARTAESTISLHDQTDDEPEIVVAPLLKTEWGQNKPFNLMTPSIDGEQTLAGCVATAMTQVMNYYKWPEAGQGSVHYETPDYDEKMMDIDFTQSVYDWGNMSDTYDGTESDQTHDMAVALLTRDVGAALHMMYGIESSESYGFDVNNVFVKHFNYKAESYCMSDYSAVEWVKLVESFLDESDPLTFSGADWIQDAGHSYVVDGYDSNDYLHVNWGWYGYGDGYYALTAFGMEPYNFNAQMMFIHATPNRTGNVLEESPVPVWCMVSFEDYEGQSLGNSVEMEKDKLSAVVKVSMEQASWKPFYGDVRAYLRDGGGNVVRYLRHEENVSFLHDPYTFYINLTPETLEGLDAGAYDLVVETRDDDSRGQWIKWHLEVDRPKIIVKNHSVNLRNDVRGEASVAVKEMHADKSEVAFGDYIRWNMTFATDGDEDHYADYAYIFLENVNDHDDVSMVDSVAFSAFAGLETKIAFKSHVLAYNGFEEGTYLASVWLKTADDQYEPMRMDADPVRISVTKNLDKYATPYVAGFYVIMIDKDYKVVKDYETSIDDVVDDVIDVDFADYIEQVWVGVGIRWAQPESGGYEYNTKFYLYSDSYFPKEEIFNNNGYDGYGTVTLSNISAFDSSEYYGKVLKRYVYHTLPYSKDTPVLCDKNGTPYCIKLRFRNSLLETGIEDVNAAQRTASECYDVHGRQLVAPVKGLNIIRTGDGNVKKVLVK